jgi:uncharacterized protein
MNKVKLNVLGISYSQTQSGAYALVLTEENGDRRIPIIVGGFEAQAIAIQLEGLHPPRPLTHDLFLNFAKSFNISLLEVIIHKLEEGVFYARLICDNGSETITIDSRTSDAIALALRFLCPIYTTEEIMQKAGVIVDFENESSSKQSKTTKAEPVVKTEKQKAQDNLDNEFSFYNNDELQKLLEEAVSQENYERASAIRDEINRRSKK